MAQKVPYSYDVLGNIVIMKFPDDLARHSRPFPTSLVTGRKDSLAKSLTHPSNSTINLSRNVSSSLSSRNKISLGEKKKIAQKFLKDTVAVKTVLEKTGKFKGRLRKMQTRWLAGEKNKEALYKENGCVFRFNIDDTYFSPRLSNERKDLAGKIKKGDEVLVMFAGVAPLPIVLAKNNKGKVEKIYSVEINRKASKYAKQNVRLNNVDEIVEVVQGDVKKIIPKFEKKFDVIMMPRPQLKDSFLKEAFKVSKKGTRIYYYDFCLEEEVDKIFEKIKMEAKSAKKKIKILKNSRAGGSLAPGKIRVRVDFVVE